MVQGERPGDVAREEQGGEGGVDNVIVLISFDGAGFGNGAFADGGGGGAEGGELGQDGGGGEGLYFDGDGGPFGEEAALEFSVVWMREEGEVSRCVSGIEADFCGGGRVLGRGVYLLRK